MFKFVKLFTGAIIPTRATTLSAGYDLHAYEGGVIHPKHRLLVKTAIGWKMDNEYSQLVGIIKPRSGLAHKNGIDVLAGVIDADYIEEDIGVILYNTGDQDFVFEKGKAIAQLVVTQFFMTEQDRIDTVQDELTKRDGGFDSTGR